MSTVLANTITAVGGGGSTVKVNNDSTLISEGGAVTDQNLVQGVAKAWARTNMATAANLDSLNISGLTDNGTGNFTVAINNDMANANYCTTDSADNAASDTNVSNQVESVASGTYVILHAENGSQVDTTIFSSAVLGDLA